MTDSPFQGIEDIIESLEAPFRLPTEFDTHGFFQNLIAAGSYFLLNWMRNEIRDSYENATDAEDIEILD